MERLWMNKKAIVGYNEGGDWAERVHLHYIGKWRGVGQVFACVANLMVRMGW